ncbi:MAG: type II toxin-antitoxin system HigB family toxin [Candidatus Omnitrophica bacterium]|nr:type II toxin-antitoxin system HigB family toxin [Candidatus Omnitrophota bacterium]
MKLLGKKLLHEFMEAHADARSQIESWEAEVEEIQWSNPHDLKSRYPKASIIKDQHVVFDFCWNKYRLLVQINYKNGIVLVKKIGTHKEYDSWGIT